MKRLACAVALIAAGCGAPEIPDMPPATVGGGSVSPMQEAKTPREAYELAYSRMSGYHTKVRSFLASKPVNEYGVQRTIEQIAEALETMHAVAVDPHKSDLKPYIRWYRESAKGPWAGSFETEFRKFEREIKSRFATSLVDVLAEFPKEGAADPPKPPPGPDTPKPTPPKPPAPPSGDVPVWMLYNAWKQSHADLVDACAKKVDCAKPYARVRESVTALKARLPEERQKKLALCDASYEQQHDETKGFTALPPGGKQEDVLRVLKLIGEMMEAEYNPDKK